MKGLYKRGDVWWIQFTPATGAERVRESLGTRDEAAAILKARELMARASREVREQLASCDHEIDCYLAVLRRDGLANATLETREYVLKAFVKELDVATPRMIAAVALERWFYLRLEKNRHTAVSYFLVIRWWLGWLVERGKLAQNVAGGIKVPAVGMVQRKNFLLPGQVRKILDECTDKNLKFVLYCGFHAGLRKNEIIEARPDWFDLEKGLLHVQKTETFEPKDRDNRTIPLTAEFREWLKEVYGLPSPYMLAPLVKKGKSRYRYDFRRPYTDHVARCGLDVTFHDARRSFASNLVSAGVSLYKVAKWLGDNAKTVEECYGHLIPQDDEINAWCAPIKKIPKK